MPKLRYLFAMQVRSYFSSTVYSQIFHCNKHKKMLSAGQIRKKRRRSRGTCSRCFRLRQMSFCAFFLRQQKLFRVLALRLMRQGQRFDSLLDCVTFLTALSRCKQHHHLTYLSVSFSYLCLMGAYSTENGRNSSTSEPHSMFSFWRRSVYTFPLNVMGV